VAAAKRSTKLLKEAQKVLQQLKACNWPSVGPLLRFSSCGKFENGGTAILRWAMELIDFF
jgi:hypothetical protein